LHILFIPSWYPASPGETLGSFFREQALALRSYGLNVGVITPAMRSLGDGASAWLGPFGIREELDEGMTTLRYHGVRAFSWNHALNIQFWERTGLLAFARYASLRGLPDLLHVHGTIFGLAWARAIHRSHGIPFVVTEHSSEFALNQIRRPLLDYITAAIQPAAHLFGVSESLCNQLSTQVPPPAGKRWKVMPNLVSSRFAPTQEVVRPTGQEFTFLNVAALHRNKGQHHLLRAFASALHIRPDLSLRIAGDGPEAAALHELARGLGIASQVSFLGNCSRDRVALEMQNCDAFVLSSSYETFGVVAVEALMSGKPIVATRCGGPEDIVVPGVDGVLVTKDDPDALSLGLLQMSNDYRRFDATSIRARCIERFSEVAFAGRHAAAYERALAGGIEFTP